MYQKEGVVSSVNEVTAASLSQKKKVSEWSWQETKNAKKEKKKQQLLLIYTSTPNLNRQGGQKGEENNKEKC